MEPRRESVVRVLGVNRPGLLTCTAQVFSSVNLAVEAFRLDRDAADPTIAIIEIAFLADERNADLVRGRLSRLVDVLDVIPVEGFAAIGTDEDCVVAHAGGAAVV